MAPTLRKGANGRWICCFSSLFLIPFPHPKGRPPASPPPHLTPRRVPVLPLVTYQDARCLGGEPAQRSRQGSLHICEGVCAG